MFRRPEVYSGAEDNTYRFSFFSRAVLALYEQLDWIPNVIYGHDWVVRSAASDAEYDAARPPYSCSLNNILQYTLAIKTRQEENETI